jgi:hypothetical protein
VAAAEKLNSVKKHQVVTDILANAIQPAIGSKETNIIKALNISSCSPNCIIMNESCNFIVDPV